MKLDGKIEKMYKVTNQELFDSKATEVEVVVKTWTSESSFDGHVSIKFEEKINNQWSKESTGEHNCDDFQEEFGFIIT